MDLTRLLLKAVIPISAAIESATEAVDRAADRILVAARPPAERDRMLEDLSEVHPLVIGVNVAKHILGGLPRGRAGEGVVHMGFNRGRGHLAPVLGAAIILHLIQPSDDVRGGAVCHIRATTSGVRA